MNPLRTPGGRSARLTKPPGVFFQQDQMIITLDFETASTVDLKVVGAHRYWADPTTEILCLAWHDDTGRVGEWRPGDSPGYLNGVLAKQPQHLFEAHNAAFEIEGWRQHMVPLYGFHDIANERWLDTLAVCAHKALPLNLDKAAEVLSLIERKDTAASKFTISLSKPLKDGSYDRSPASMVRVIDYCHQDCTVEAELSARVGRLPQAEQQVWQMNLEINQRGIGIDVPYVRACQQVVDQTFVPMAAEYTKITGLYVTQTIKSLAWVRAQGVQLPDMTKETLATVLKRPDLIEEEDEAPGAEPSGELLSLARTIPEQVRRALEIRALIGSASVKKLERMLLCTMPDSRARGLSQYHGAATGRDAGRLFQPLNFPRPIIHAPVDQTVGAIMTGDASYVAAVLGNPIDVVIGGLRHALVPTPGACFSVGDFAGIEARVVLALAGQYDKTALMASGADVYCDLASVIFHRPITKADEAERHAGKGGVLGCGFGLNWKGFITKFAPGMTEAEARAVITAYREGWAPLVPRLWFGLWNAALETVWTGQPHEFRGIEYRIEDAWLTGRLPSGRKIWYFNPQRTLSLPPWEGATEQQRGFTYQAWKMGRWRTIRAWHGMTTENVVQAMARDLLVHAMFICRHENLPIVLTVYDEIVAESTTSLEQIMSDRPRWAVDMGIPIKAECWQGTRYKKG